MKRSSNRSGSERVAAVEEREKMILLVGFCERVQGGDGDFVSVRDDDQGKR